MDHIDEGQWFIINTLTQYEKKVREAVQRQIALADPEIPVFEVQFPVEVIVEKRNGKTKSIERKLFPGYVFVRMKLYTNAEGTELNEKVWHFINGIKGVSRIGGVMTPEEVAEWITVPGSEEAAPQPVARSQFNVGDQVEITDGPFTGFKGVVKEIDVERGFLRVETVVFNRATMMELEFTQVEKYVE